MDPHTELDSLISTELDNCLISTELDSDISTQLDSCQISTELGAVHKLCRLKIGDFWPPPPPPLSS